LEDDAVKRAYLRLYREELETLFADRIRAADWLRWAWSALSARIDSLSPFWLTFWLTIAFSFSQAFLALPTGVASIGAVPGMVLVLAIGAINTLTMACMAESCARSGDLRYGRAFVGRLVTNYLGWEASLLFSAIAALRTFLVMLAGSIGIGLTLAASTGIRAEAWIAVLCAVELYYLSRRSLNVTVATMLSLVGVNLLLFLVISGVALSQAQPVNLLRMPLLRGGPFDATLLKLVFGVTVMLYIGHVYLIQCAKIVLPRDPGARSLIRGSVAGTAVLTAVFAVWILAVNGVVTAEKLLGEAGTALSPLSAQIGPAISVLGALLVIVLLGMSCLRTSTVLFNLVQERLPARLRAVVTLPRHRGDLLLQPRGPAAGGGPRLGVRYLGLAEGQARLRVDAQWDGEFERTEVRVAKMWDAAELLVRHAGGRPPGGHLALEVLEAEPEAARLRITTTMSPSVSGAWSEGGWRPGDATGLEDSRRQLVNWLTRRGEASLDEVVRDRGGEPAEVRTMLDALVAQGFAEPVAGPGGARYRIRLAGRRGRRIPAEIWEALGPPGPAGRSARRQGPGGMALSAWQFILSESGRFLVSASPVLLVFLICEALLLTGSASFAGVLGFGGVIANSLTAGIFPVLLLFASRRKGDYVPGVAYGLLGHPVFTIAVYGLSLANLVLHGLVIYRTPWVRVCALVVSLAVVGVTARMIRRGAFGGRSVIELREDMREGGRVLLAITSGGRALTADVRLGRPDGEEAGQMAAATAPSLSGLRHAVLHLPPGQARELKVWAHRVTPEGASEGLPALVEISAGNETSRFDLRLSSGQVIIPVTGACSVRITFPGPDVS
jgi:amino acid permease